MSKKHEKMVARLNNYASRSSLGSVTMGLLSLVSMSTVAYCLFTMRFMGKEVFNIEIVRLLAGIGLLGVFKMLYLTFERSSISDNRRFLGQALVINDEKGEKLGETHTVEFLDRVDRNLAKEILTLQILVSLPLIAVALLILIAM